METWERKIKPEWDLPTELIGKPTVHIFVFMNKTFLVVLQESWRLCSLFCWNVHTSTQLPLPENSSSPQALAVVISCWLCVCCLSRYREVYRFITWLSTNCVLRFPLLRNVPSSNMQLPTARVSCVLLSLSRRLWAPPARPLQAACGEERIETSFVLLRVGILESRRAGGGVHDRFGPRGQRQGGEDAVIHR